jgi:excisionase family DNA binding protein
MAANNPGHNATRAVNSVVVRAPAVGASRRLMTLRAAAALLSVSVPSVRRLIAGSHLPCVRFNRRLLVDTKDLDRFIERSRQSVFGWDTTQHRRQ